MRLTAYHDNNGNIVGLAFSPSDDSTSAEVMTQTQPRLRTTDVELPSGVDLDPDNPQLLNEKLAMLAEEYQVESRALVRK